MTNGRSRSPHATVTGTLISSRRDHAARPLFPDSSGISFLSAIAFMASASSRAGPETRPSGPRGPSSQSHISTRLISSSSPEVCASSHMRTRRSVSASNVLGSGAPLTDGARSTEPGDPFRRCERRVDRDLAAHRAAHEPDRPGRHVVDHGVEVLEVREAVRGAGCLSVATHVVRDDADLGLEGFGNVLPGAAVRDARMEQDRRVARGPASARRRGWRCPAAR